MLVTGIDQRLDSVQDFSHNSFDYMLKKKKTYTVDTKSLDRCNRSTDTFWFSAAGAKGAGIDNYFFT